MSIAGLKYIKQRFEEDELHHDDMEWLINKVEELEFKYRNLLNKLINAIDENNKM